MKKTLFVIALVTVLSLALAGSVSANGGPHGGYTATTDACAGCHRTHTAQSANLLVSNSSYGLCIACHGSSGAGANTNVDDGFYLSTRDDSVFDQDVGAANTPDNAALLGGGFVNYGGMGVTSSHNATGVASGAWGNGVDRGVQAALASPLNCASCHDPHGSPNYRIISVTVNGTAIVVPQVDEAAKDYDTEQWSTGQSNLCAACHTAYHVTTAGAGSDAAEAVNGGFTHRVDMNYAYGANANPETVGMSGYTLPLAESGTNNTVVCQTCHLPHGTAANMSLGAIDALTNDSSLLRLDNRGVCEVCHQK